MKRWTRIGLAAALAAGVAGLVAAAGAGAHAGRHAIMKRVAAAVVDEALDQARVTPEQRQQIHGVRDRLFDTVAEHRRARLARLDEVLAAFEADALDPARVDALRLAAEEEHRRLAAAIGQALAEVHQVLTPDQRRALADYVRAQRQRHAGW